MFTRRLFLSLRVRVPARLADVLIVGGPEGVFLHVLGPACVQGWPRDEALLGQEKCSRQIEIESQRADLLFSTAQVEFFSGHVVSNRCGNP